MSLSDVAEKVDISVATLSRIETEKQSIGVDLMIALANVVGVTPAEVLDGSGAAHDQGTDLARELAVRSPAERAEIIVRATKQSGRSGRGRESIAAQIESLLAAIDLMMEQIGELRKLARRRTR